MIEPSPELTSDAGGAVVVRVMGGIGNQFFQYATARALALDRGVPLMLDTLFYEEQSSRQFELDRFQIEAEVLTRETSRSLARWRQQSSRLRRLRRLLPFALYRDWQYFHEGAAGYNPAIRSTAAHVYLDGYWQSEKYFADVAPTVRQELTLREQLSTESRESVYDS